MLTTSRVRAWLHGAAVALVLATAVAVIAQQPVAFLSPQAVTGPLTDTQLRATAVPISGTFWQATQPVSAASWPLPTGAATESTLGGVLTTADFDTKTGSLTETAPASDTASSGLSGRLQRIAQRITSLIALLPSALGANGGLKIEGVASGTVVPISVASIPSHAVTNAGTFATQSAVTAASGAFASGALASGAIASGAAVSGAFADGAVVTLGAKADAKSTATDTTAITIMQVLKQISASVQVPPSQSPAASAASGDAVSPCNVLATASTNATSCKGSAGNLYGYSLTNTTTTVYYLRLYNASAAPTCSSATGFVRSIPIPPAAAAGGVGGIVDNGTFGVQFSTGIGYCLTGGSSSTDNTNAAAGVLGELRYK